MRLCVKSVKRFMQKDGQKEEQKEEVQNSAKTGGADDERIFCR